MLIVLLIVLGLILLGCLITYIERHRLAITGYEYDCLDKKCRGLKSRNINETCSADKRIAFISDLHCCSFGENNKRLIDRIMSYNPDILVIAGDMVVGSNMKKIPSAMRFLMDISHKLPVYYGFGNHERKVCDLGLADFYFSVVQSLENVTILRNESVRPFEESNLRIYGFDEPVEFFKRGNEMPRGYVDCFLGKKTEDTVLLIAHDPYYFEHYSSWGADLTFAGHLHGGIMRLPLLGGVISPRYQLFPKYDAGCFTKGDSTMLVSRGLGNHAVPFRIFDLPEIGIIDLKNI